jgi:hypothetical protein
MTAEAAGVDRKPFLPTRSLETPLARLMRVMSWAAEALK